MNTYRCQDEVEAISDNLKSIMQTGKATVAQLQHMQGLLEVIAIELHKLPVPPYAPGAWDDHPSFPSADWVADVKAGQTKLGYWEWVVCKIEAKSMIDYHQSQTERTTQ